MTRFSFSIRFQGNPQKACRVDCIYNVDSLSCFLLWRGKSRSLKVIIHHSAWVLGHKRQFSTLFYSACFWLRSCTVRSGLYVELSRQGVGNVIIWNRRLFVYSEHHLLGSAHRAAQPRGGSFQRRGATPSWLAKLRTGLSLTLRGYCWRWHVGT